jgi:hypothetical protein
MSPSLVSRDSAGAKREFQNEFFVTHITREHCSPCSHLVGLLVIKSFRVNLYETGA